jgi:predicted permease
VIDTLLSAVLPVFALVAIGFGLGRLGLFDQAMAGAVNRFVFLVSVPALIFGLLIRSPFAQFNWLALAAFAAIEIVMYGAGFVVARYAFKRETKEALLIGLATAFANHLLFVLPIAVTLFGERATTPIVAIATVDALFIYGGTLLLMDVLSDTGASLARVARAFSKNPQIIAAIGGLGVGLSGAALPEGIHVFTRFAGSTAAPCALFALGVVLSRQAGEGALSLPIAISGLKLVVYPLLCLGLIRGILGVELDWAKPALMVAAAPSSAMAFVLALNYQVPTKAIVRIILITMIGALLTVTFVAGI